MSTVTPAGRGTTILQEGRPKAYRPLAVAARRSAFAEGLAAYRRGDFFEAHERLEPAWMGASDVAERNLHQGLIKLAAAYVHAVRGNPRGIAKNLVGARHRLALASGAADAPAVARRLRADLDLASIVAAIDDRLALLADRPDAADVPAIPLPARRPVT